MHQDDVIEISPLEAWEMLQKESRSTLIDVRSEMEYLFVGHPPSAVNIPWIEEPEWKINPHFVRDVRKLVLGGIIEYSGHNAVPILLICRSGNRSEEAGNLLVDEGFRHVYNVQHGFEGELDEQHHRSTLSGWRYDGLPWQQC